MFLSTNGQVNRLSICEWGFDSPQEHQMKKICNECREEKDITLFRRDRRIKSGYQGRCKSCVSQAIKNAYPSSYREKANARSLTHRKRNRELKQQYLSGRQCANCGEPDLVVFEFHHPDPTQKDFTIGDAHSHKWDDILSEMEKCIILCANCHRKEHYRLRLLQQPKQTNKQSPLITL